MVKLRFRGRQLLLLALFLLFVIILFNAGGWLFYHQASPYLDHQLGEKLKAIATTAALGLSPDLVESYQDPGARFLLTDYLQQIQAQNELDAVHLFDLEGKTLASTSRLSRFQMEDPTVTLDQEAVALAISGLPSASRLYCVDGYYLKSGYAPVEDLQGEIRAILGAEASASYFQVLSQFKKTMLLLGVISLLFLVAAGLLFFKLIDSLAQTEMAILRADALATLGRMAAHMAHEIRNPLSIIRGAVQRLHANSSLREVDRELLGFLPEEVDRLDEIVSRYLNFAHIEPLNLTDVELITLVNETLAMARRELADKGVQISVSAPETMPTIRLDAPRMKQALLNLLLNAVQAMPRGGEIQVVLTLGKKWVQLSVSDTGQGISKQQIGKIFEPFFTTKKMGSGLGLAMVAKIVEDHKGRIRVQSEPDKGTTFILSLPTR